MAPGGAASGMLQSRLGRLPRIAVGPLAGDAVRDTAGHRLGGGGVLALQPRAHPSLLGLAPAK